MNGQTKLLAAVVAVMLATPVPVARAAPGQVTNTVNVRSGPGFHHHVVAQLPAGQIVDVSGCQNGWCLVALGGGFGWIKTRIVLTPPAVIGAPGATAYAGAVPLTAYRRAAVALGALGPAPPLYGRTRYTPWGLAYRRGIDMTPY